MGGAGGRHSLGGRRRVEARHKSQAMLGVEARPGWCCLSAAEGERALEGGSLPRKRRQVL